MDTFSDFAPRYKELIKLSRDVAVWPFLIWDELPTWINRRACIMGDAAHAMFPSTIQIMFGSIFDSLLNDLRQCSVKVELKVSRTQ